MSLLKRIIEKKETPITSYEKFWDWFHTRQSAFHKVVKDGDNVNDNFLKALMPKLGELNDGIYPLTGMLDDDTSELIFTAEGSVTIIPVIEELVRKAPQSKNWKFTALKPALNIEDIRIEMEGYRFDYENISFYANEDSNHPDKIDITVLHDDLDDDNRSIICNGTFIYLDHLLGELAFATIIDSLNVIRNSEATKELIPIGKLNIYLNWRQKEFTEKYDGYRHSTENDAYTSFKSSLESGGVLLAVIDTDLLQWKGKVSHPWIVVISFEYDGSENNGLPNSDSYAKLDTIENELMAHLKDFEGYLNVGRQTGENVRELYFACHDFRKPAIVVAEISGKYAMEFKIEHEIFKDKYWEFFERFCL